MKKKKSPEFSTNPSSLVDSSFKKLNKGDLCDTEIA